MNAWIFQANPKYFDIDSCLRFRENIGWHIRQKRFINEVMVDDSVYIWRSENNYPGTGGIVAKGKIISPSFTIHSIEEDPSPDASEFIFEEGDGEEKFPIGVCILNVVEFRLSEKEGMITREELKDSIYTKNMLILKMPRHTNYKIENNVGDYINKLWVQKKRKD